MPVDSVIISPTGDRRTGATTNLVEEAFVKQFERVSPIGRLCLALFACAVAALLATCSSDEPTKSGDPAPTAPTADYYVNALTGNDSNQGSLASPFKTITHALSVAGPGDTIQVAPGVYDGTNGETFPIQMPDSVALFGDTLNRGAGVDSTVIKGRGDVTPPYRAALVGANAARVAGFLFTDSASLTLQFGVYSDGDDFTVDNSSFARLYGGVRLGGTGDQQVLENSFSTDSYGVYDWCLGAVLISGNEFLTPSIPVDIVFSTEAVLRANVFSAGGNCGVQIQHGLARLESNVFNGDFNPNYGAILGQSNSTAIARNNSFDCETSPCVEIWSSGKFDFGTAIAPGGNVFSGLSGIAIRHKGTDTVSAFGNTWHAATPVCGTHIVIDSTGIVIWGSDPGEQCP